MSQSSHIQFPNQETKFDIIQAPQKNQSNPQQTNPTKQEHHPSSNPNASNVEASQSQQSPSQSSSSSQQQMMSFSNQQETTQNHPLLQNLNEGASNSQQTQPNPSMFQFGEKSKQLYNAATLATLNDHDDKVDKEKTSIHKDEYQIVCNDENGTQQKMLIQYPASPMFKLQNKQENYEERRACIKKQQEKLNGETTLQPISNDNNNFVQPPRKKRSYNHIPEEVKLKLIELAENPQTNIRLAAKKAKVNYSSAKCIIKASRDAKRALRQGFKRGVLSRPQQCSNNSGVLFGSDGVVVPSILDGQKDQNPIPALLQPTPQITTSQLIQQNRNYQGSSSLKVEEEEGKNFDEIALQVVGKIRSVIDQHLIEASASGNNEILSQLLQFSRWLTGFYVEYGKIKGSRSNEKIKEEIGQKLSRYIKEIAQSMSSDNTFAYFKQFNSFVVLVEGLSKILFLNNNNNNVSAQYQHLCMNNNNNNNNNNNSTGFNNNLNIGAYKNDGVYQNDLAYKNVDVANHPKNELNRGKVMMNHADEMNFRQQQQQQSQQKPQRQPQPYISHQINYPFYATQQQSQYNHQFNPYQQQHHHHHHHQQQILQQQQVQQQYWFSKPHGGQQN